MTMACKACRSVENKHNENILLEHIRLVSNFYLASMAPVPILIVLLQLKSSRIGRVTLRFVVTDVYVSYM